MYVKYTALFTWFIASMSRNRGRISSSNAMSFPSELPAEFVDVLESDSLRRIAPPLPFRGERSLCELRVRTPRQLDAHPVSLLGALDDARRDADGDAPLGNLDPLRDDSAGTDDGARADAASARDDRAHPDDAIGSYRTSVDNRSVSYGHPVPDRYRIPDVRMEDR